MSFLPVGMIGVSYKCAPLSLREQFSRVAQKMEESLVVKEKYSFVILSTCNRTEIYFSGEDLSEARADFIAWFQSQGQEGMVPLMVFCEEKECFVHLVKVASGLDSAIFAETEIQGQVKRAYASAAKQRILSSSLHYFFQKSLHVAKGLRNAIFLDKGSATLYGTLWEIAQGYFSDLFSQRVLFVGYSKINLGFISFLSRRGLSRFSLATEHGEQIVLEGVSVAGRVLLQRWTEFDWIVCAAKSEKFLIQGQMQGNPLIFDLSVPRNVDPSLQGGGQLWNMEQIHQKIEKGQRARPSDAIEPMIEAQIARLKFGVARESGKRDDIADIFHSCGK